MRFLTSVIPPEHLPYHFFSGFLFTGRPHLTLPDTTFRQSLSAADVVRAFLPAELRALCDLNPLKLESGLLVEDDLRQYASNILWSMQRSSIVTSYHPLILPGCLPAAWSLRYAVYGRCIQAGPPKHVPPTTFPLVSACTSGFSSMWKSMWLSRISSDPSGPQDISVRYQCCRLYRHH
ncbi:TPA: Rpn family recombination-promoting nuclease/putative transposase [Salmonella enterica subsp. diarizonae serovar 48:i:z35]|nr:Rpn family recombination-promoting nuclease/putative transposase [Salmonella enterica]HCM1651989.1 Rpn family recombination-promoting nuclease/putative transposase [Salmonella enterica subsp. diarizonae serovar 48:i:z35]